MDVDSCGGASVPDENMPAVIPETDDENSQAANTDEELFPVDNENIKVPDGKDRSSVSTIHLIS